MRYSLAWTGYRTGNSGTRALNTPMQCRLVSRSVNTNSQQHQPTHSHDSKNSRLQNIHETLRHWPERTPYLYHPLLWMFIINIMIFGIRILYFFVSHQSLINQSYSYSKNSIDLVWTLIVCLCFAVWHACLSIMFSVLRSLPCLSIYACLPGNPTVLKTKPNKNCRPHHVVWLSWVASFKNSSPHW